VAAGFEALVIAPTTQPLCCSGKNLRQFRTWIGTLQPVPGGESIVDVATADLPLDPFAADMQRKVLKVLAAANVTLICQGARQRSSGDSRTG